MDSRAKVIAGKIANRAEDAEESNPVTVDNQIVELLKNLTTGEQGRSFLEIRNDSLETLAQDLRRAQRFVASRDHNGLDKLAQELSHNALKLGAGKILSSAIEIQGLARIGDFKTASEILGLLEVELMNVREQLV